MKTSRLLPVFRLFLVVIFCMSFFRPLSANVLELYEEIRVHNAKVEARLSEWSKRARLHADHMTVSSHPKLVKWREQLTQLDFGNEVDALKKLNRFINEDITYIDDYHHFHKADYCTDPETTVVEGGDCEDFALVKASVLQRFNWPADRMHLLIGFLTERGEKESHAVLMVETSTGDQLILRSITNDMVHPSEFRFIPIYAVDQFSALIVKSRDPQLLLLTQNTAAP